MRKKISLKIYPNTLKKSSKTGKIPIYLKLVYNGKKSEIRIPYDFTENELSNWDSQLMFLREPKSNNINYYISAIILKWQKYKNSTKDSLSNIIEILLSNQATLGATILENAYGVAPVGKVPIESECCQVPKEWGHELIIVNNELYCGKILFFKAGFKFSMHYHIQKQETWYVNKGNFKFRYIRTDTTEIIERDMKQGDSVTIPIGMPHQLEALCDGEIFEISTQHFDSDSYRVWR